MPRHLKNTSKMTWIFSVVGALIISFFGIQAAQAKLSGSLSEEAIEKRLQPMGQVEIEGVVAQPKKAKAVGGPTKIYKDNCAMCHKIGLANAPKLGVKSDWTPRLKQGMDTLVKKAIAGFGAMPPRGNCITCSDEDIQKTVQYMLEESK